MRPDASAEETQVTLLEDTQAYLQSLLRRQAPDSVLAEAWQEFYRVYNNLIRRFVIARGVRDADVDDCIQDVWSEVAIRLGDFRRERNRPGLRAWLYTVVRSKATDLLRRKARHAAKKLDEAVQAGVGDGSWDSDPAVVYERQWEDALLHTVLAELRTQVSDVSYHVLHMRLVEGREVSEVAGALKLTPEQVRYRQHRMLRKLRARLAVYTGKHFGEAN